MFYRPVGVTTEVRAGYLFKSPPQKRLKTEVTVGTMHAINAALCVFFLLNFIIYFNHAEIMEEAVFCAVQSQRARTPTEVL